MSATYQALAIRLRALWRAITKGVRRSAQRWDDEVEWFV